MLRVRSLPVPFSESMHCKRMPQIMESGLECGGVAPPDLSELTQSPKTDLNHRDINLLFLA